MIDAHTVYAILALIVIFATAFFFAPHRVATIWHRDDLPVHWIMQHFRYWERRRVWISATGLGAGVILASLFASSIFTYIVAFVGLMSLACADAFQVRRLVRDLPGWPPSTEIDREASSMSPILDLLFGAKPNSDKGGK
jgi:hypothetical protein